jgi:hypothetical protein
MGIWSGIGSWVTGGSFFDGYLGGNPRDDMTEIDRAITRNEVRGDADAVPRSWYDARDQGIRRFDDAPPGWEW